MIFRKRNGRARFLWSTQRGHNPKQIGFAVDGTFIIWLSNWQKRKRFFLAIGPQAWRTWKGDGMNIGWKVPCSSALPDSIWTGILTPIAGVEWATLNDYGIEERLAKVQASRENVK